MGTVIPFPDAWRIPSKRLIGGPVESATITILPVVRIERHDDTGGREPDATTTSGRRRRRRARS
jgi:uncharacterized spore protein YtfJ